RVGIGTQALERLLAHARHAALARGEAVQAEPRRDRVEPGRELGLAAEVLHGPMDSQKDLLGDLLGLAPIAQHPERHPEDPVLVGDHQLLEGPWVAPLQPGFQVGVIANPPFHPVRPYRPLRVPRRSKFAPRLARARGGEPRPSRSPTPAPGPAAGSRAAGIRSSRFSGPITAPSPSTSTRTRSSRSTARRRNSRKGRASASA